MTVNFKAPENVILKPIITVFGVGGAGGNAVNNMIKCNLTGAKFVVANTDAQALEHSACENKIQLGVSCTKGLGAGASPEVGKNAAIESEAEIRAYLENSNMVFITAGMGGGTGTGASPVIAALAKEMGILTVGVVTKPFSFEGQKRMKIADSGLEKLQEHVDTLIIIPNQNLFRVANEKTTFTDAFTMADEVLHAGVRSVTDLITTPGLINLDFADIKTVMSEMGKAMMGTGEAEGDDRAIKAAEAAISNPLLDQTSMKGASGVLINITGGNDMTLYELDDAANRIKDEVGEENTNIMFGSTFNPELEGKIRVSVVATGIDAHILKAEKQKQELFDSQLDNSNKIEEIDMLVDDINTEKALDEAKMHVDSDNDNNLFEAQDEISGYDDESQEPDQQEQNFDLNNSDYIQGNEDESQNDKSDAIKPKKQSLFKRLWKSFTADEIDDNNLIKSNQLENNNSNSNSYANDSFNEINYNLHNQQQYKQQPNHNSVSSNQNMKINQKKEFACGNDVVKNRPDFLHKHKK